MADDPNEAIRRFLETTPGSLGLEAKLAEIQAENERLESELAAVEKNRSALIREKRMAQGRPDKALKGTATELFITRSASLDPIEYRLMRSLAETQGKTLRIVDDVVPLANDGPPEASPVRYVGDKEAGVLFINAAIRDRVGIARVQEIAHEQGYKEARTFRSTRDLPDHLLQQHTQQLVDREPGTLLEGNA